MKSINPSQRRKTCDINALKKSGYLNQIEDDGCLVCCINGPKDTPYTGMKFTIRITLPFEYPFRSPSIGFIGHVFHPNVDWESGSICLNALNQEWTPVYNLVSIVSTLIPQLLTYPNPEDPLNVEAAKLLQNDIEAYKERCKQTA